MNSIRKIAFFLIIFFLIQACEDFLEVEIDKETVKLRSPGNGVVSEAQTQVFWWDELHGAEYYKLQIVSLSFDSLFTLVEEVEITDATSYETTLNNGVYQWTVIGVNNAYESIPEHFDLTIMTDTSKNLSNQVVSLVSPEHEEYLNTLEVTFLWQHLADADEYRLQVASPDFSNSTHIKMDLRTSEDFKTTILEDGVYRWRVRGENDSSVSPYSTRGLIIDVTPPMAPVLVSPAYNEIISPPSLLTWQVDQASVLDTLFVYADSLIQPPIIVLPTAETEYLFDVQTSGSYFWRVRSIDQAGNASAFSALRKFFVN